MVSILSSEKRDSSELMHFVCLATVCAVFLCVFVTRTVRHSVTLHRELEDFYGPIAPYLEKEFAVRHDCVRRGCLQEVPAPELPAA